MRTAKMAGLWLAALGVFLGFAPGRAETSLKATVVDRYGNQHEVDRFSFQGRAEIEYYMAGQRRILSLDRIARMLYEGERGDEEQTVVVTLRSGRQETGSMLTGGSATPHQDAVGGGGSARRFTGVTKLGPFFILLSDVREIIFHYDEEAEAPPPEEPLKATIVTLEGKRFEVANLLYRGRRRLDYVRGQDRRFVPLDKVEKIDFDDSSSGAEFRPITITLWSGKSVQGHVDASTVRLSGETDKSFYERISAAFTGRTQVGAFAIGLHQLKQIRFHPPKQAEEEGEEGNAQAGAVD